MAPYSQPELVIGVDFGMSQTGVAYCKEPWASPEKFQKWSSIPNEISDKTPSRLAYEPGTGAVRDWGLFVNVDDKSVDVKEYFKLQLDPSYQDEFQDIRHEDARRYYRDYLTCLHTHIARFFSRSYPQWATMHVEWNFSVPTTWNSPTLVRSLTEIMAAAGFGKDGKLHTCAVTLTEAEAAAICVAEQHLRRDDVILVCDSGGGTTDVNILKLRSDPGEPIQLHQLLQIEGRAIGSALIDIKVQQHLAQRLNHVQNHLSSSPVHTAERMMLGKFERVKCSFGSAGMNTAKLRLEIPGLQPGIDFPVAGIIDSHIEISTATIKKIFDEQVANMVDLIEEQLQELLRNRPGEQVSYLVLSGGLGSSEYVQSRLKSHFEAGQGSALQNARSLRLIVAENPQLAVVVGLVKHRAQQIGRNITPIGKRCAPLSYGVVVNQVYNPSVHVGQNVMRDPRDKKRWAVDRIQWLIEKGEDVPEDGVTRRFKAKLYPAQKHKPWTAHFVFSALPRDELPKSMEGQHFGERQCIVKANVANVKTLTRNHHWWNSGLRHELAIFDVRLIPGYADLQFQITNGNRILNYEANRVQVEWGASSSRMSVASSDGLNQMY